MYECLDWDALENVGAAGVSDVAQAVKDQSEAMATKIEIPPTSEKKSFPGAGFGVWRLAFFQAISEAQNFSILTLERVYF